MRLQQRAEDAALGEVVGGHRPRYTNMFVLQHPRVQGAGRLCPVYSASGPSGFALSRAAAAVAMEFTWPSTRLAAVIFVASHLVSGLVRFRP